MTYIPTIIKSVQRGTVVIGNGSTSNTTTVTAVNMAQAGLRFLGASLDNGGSADGFSGIYLSDASTVTGFRAGATGTLTIEFELVEYLTTFVNSVQRGLITNVSVTSVDTSVNPVNMAKAELRWLGNSTTDPVSGNFSRQGTRLELTSSNNIRCSVGSAFVTQVTSFELIEFK